MRMKPTRKSIHSKYCLFKTLGLVCGLTLFVCNYATAQTTTPFSHYGVIQNVQNYSSNPFWSPNAPYNQRMPTAVYAMGPDVETGDCLSIVTQLISTQCEMMNNCISAQLTDIRPAIMLQLSRIPGGNYATACGGYIDTIFQKYVDTHSIAGQTSGASFPSVYGIPSVTTGKSGDYQIPNPFAAPATPEWKQEMLDRKQELKDLQSANGVTTPGLARATAPLSSADLTFAASIDNATAGYQPFAGRSAYNELKIESQQDYLSRQADIARQHRDEYCHQNPNAPECKTNEQKSDTRTDDATQLVDNKVDVIDNEILFIL